MPRHRRQLRAKANPRGYGQRGPQGATPLVNEPNHRNDIRGVRVET